MVLEDSRSSKLANLKSRRKFMVRSVTTISSIFLSFCSRDNDKDDPAPNPQQELDKTLAFIGDSMTAGTGGTTSYGYLVATALSRPVIIDAIGGQNSSQITARQGGIEIKISVEGNAFKGEEVVKITRISNEFLSTPATANRQSRKATVNGVKCTIFREGQINPNLERYAIKPDSKHNSLITENTIAVLDNAIKMKTATQVLWMGRNNVGSASMVEDVKASIEQAVDYITEPKRYVIIGILPSVPEIKSSNTYKVIAELNSQLKNKYGNRFIDMPTPTPEEIAEVNYSLTESDKIEIENGVFPRGLRADKTHLNSIGYQIVANRVTLKLKELKY